MQQLKELRCPLRRERQCLLEVQLFLELLQLVLHTGQRSGCPTQGNGRSVLMRVDGGVCRFGETAR